MGFVQLFLMGFFNERSSNKKASTFPEAIYIKNCRGSRSGYHKLKSLLGPQERIGTVVNTVLDKHRSRVQLTSGMILRK